MNVVSPKSGPYIFVPYKLPLPLQASIHMHNISNRALRPMRRKIVATRISASAKPSSASVQPRNHRPASNRIGPQARLASRKRIAELHLGRFGHVLVAFPSLVLKLQHTLQPRRTGLASSMSHDKRCIIYSDSLIVRKTACPTSIFGFVFGV